MSMILAFLSLFGATKRTSQFKRDKNCVHCANRDPHTDAEHDEALYEMMGEKPCA